MRHPLGDFDEHFEFDGEGATQLQVGAAMPILAAADQQRVLLEISESSRLRGWRH